MLLHPNYNGDILGGTISAVLSIESGIPCCVYLLHFVAFLPLGFCFSQISGRKSVWFWFVVLVFYAIATELLQEYIPPRAFRYVDLVQDIAGIIVGVFFGYYLKFVRQTVKNDV
jgi:VanZ family protein